MRRLVLAIGLVLLLLPAQASAQNKLFQDYRKDGRINPCDYSPGELRKGLSGLPPDVQAYVPGLGDQLRRGCNTGGAGGQPATPQQQAAVVPNTSGPAPPAPRPRTVVPNPPAPKADARDVVAGTAPTVPNGPLPDIPAWVAGLLAAALAGGLVALAAVRYGALDPSGLMRSLRATVARR
ncbi:MAG TPA: hypothetical protein VGF21_14555 [Thermoleophilaceae bacterium]